jgi:hypothetical protein
MYSSNLLKNRLACHPERSEGSAVCRESRKTADSSSLSLLGMTTYGGLLNRLLEVSLFFSVESS